MGCAMLDFNFEPGVIVPQQYGTGYEMIEILRIEGLSSSYLLKGGSQRGRVKGFVNLRNKMVFHYKRTIKVCVSYS